MNNAFVKNWINPLSIFRNEVHRELPCTDLEKMHLLLLHVYMNAVCIYSSFNFFQCILNLMKSLEKVPYTYNVCYKSERKKICAQRWSKQGMTFYWLYIYYLNCFEIPSKLLLYCTENVIMNFKMVIINFIIALPDSKLFLLKKSKD